MTAPIIYQYSRTDASLIRTASPVTADADPLNPGSYLIPAFATLVVPGADETYMKQVFNTTSQVWQYVVDPTTAPGINYNWDSTSGTWVLDTAADDAAKAATLANVKQRATISANQLAMAYLDNARGLTNPSPAEIVIWETLQAEALAYNASTSAPIPTITAVAGVLSVAPATYATTVYNQSTAYTGLIPTIAAQRLTYINQIAAATDAPTVTAMTFTYHS